MRILQPNYGEKKLLEIIGKDVLKLPFQNGAPIQRAILGGALEWKGTLRVPPQPGCPRVCPPWAHRSYATDDPPFGIYKKVMTPPPHMPLSWSYLNST